MAKKSSYQKLKDEIERIKKEKNEWYGALKRSIRGDMPEGEYLILKLRFNVEDNCEKMVWSGESSYSKSK